MDLARFYDFFKLKNLILGSLIEDEHASDSNLEYEPPSSRSSKKKHVIIPESDSDSSDDDIALQYLQAVKTRGKEVKKIRLYGRTKKLNLMSKKTSSSQICQRK